MIDLGNRAGDAQEDGEGNEAVVEAKHADEEEDLEEGEADVRLGGREEDEGEQRGQAAVQHSRANLGQGRGHTEIPGASPAQTEDITLQIKIEI